MSEPAESQPAQAQPVESQPVESEPDEPRVDEDGGAAADDPGARAGVERSADDTDTGWGEAPDPEQQDREHWLRAERPPHWG